MQKMIMYLLVLALVGVAATVAVKVWWLKHDPERDDELPSWILAPAGAYAALFLALLGMGVFPTAHFQLVMAGGIACAILPLLLVKRRKNASQVPLLRRQRARRTVALAGCGLLVAGSTAALWAPAPFSALATCEMVILPLLVQMMLSVVSGRVSPHLLDERQRAVHDAAYRSAYQSLGPLLGVGALMVAAQTIEPALLNQDLPAIPAKVIYLAALGIWAYILLLPQVGLAWSQPDEPAIEAAGN